MKLTDEILQEYINYFSIHSERKMINYTKSGEYVSIEYESSVNGPKVFDIIYLEEIKGWMIKRRNNRILHILENDN